jgi:hypothetical protein
MCDICSVLFSDTVIIPVLKSVARKRLVETVIDSKTLACVCQCVSDM